MRPKTLDHRAIFGCPLVLAIFGMVGLVGALLGEGVWDVVSAGLLATSGAAVAWARFGRRRVA